MPITLILETGGALANSNSYADFNIADAYFFERQTPASIWPVAGDSEAKKAALIVASSYVDQVWRSAFKGWKVNQPQAMQWPRYEVYIDDFYWPANQIPKELKYAVCELAARSLQLGSMTQAVELLGDLKAGSVGLIEQEVYKGVRQAWEPGTRVPYPIYRKAEGLLSVLLKNEGGFISELVRS